jgi:hypothetical protein
MTRMKDPIVGLSLHSLDIDELERRIELTAIVNAPPRWCSKDECPTDCAVICTLAGG